MHVVLDTNILVSAIWSPGRNVSTILNAVFSGRLTACHDFRIIEEYDRVLHYPKLLFSEWEIRAILDPIIRYGLSVVPAPLPDVPFEHDESDRKFYEVAKFCDAVLITGNTAHFPDDPSVMTMAAFIDRYF